MNNISVDSDIIANLNSRNNEKSNIDFIISIKLSYHFCVRRKKEKKTNHLVIHSLHTTKVHNSYIVILFGNCCHRITINVWARGGSQSIAMRVQHGAPIMY
jgi:hypothetical protein